MLNPIVRDTQHIAHRLIITLRPLLPSLARVESNRDVERGCYLRHRDGTAEPRHVELNCLGKMATVDPLND